MNLEEIANSLTQYLYSIGIEGTVAFSNADNKLFAILRYNCGLKPCPDTYMCHAVIKRVAYRTRAVNLDYEIYKHE